MLELTTDFAVLFEKDKSVGGATLNRILTILETIADKDRPVGVSELARLSELPKTTVHRLLAAALRSDLVIRVDDGYLIGSRLHDLLRLVHGQIDLRDRVLPHLAELYTHTRGVVDLAVLHGSDVICVERIVPAQVRPDLPPVGGRRPAHRTTSGRVLLAFAGADWHPPFTGPASEIKPATHGDLARIRRAGVAIEQSADGALLNVAGPVLDPAGQTLAAIGVSAPPLRIQLGCLVEAVRHATRAAGAALGEPVYA